MNATDRTLQIRSAFEAMVPEFGRMERNRINYEDETGTTLVAPTKTNPFETEIHPVFPLAHHFRSKDDYEGGYTGNSYRGDHLSVPAYLGFGGDIAIFETSFHKGNAYMEIVTFPEADRDSALYRAALSLLEAEETR